MLRFSARMPSADAQPNRLSQAIAHLRARGAGFLDLTTTNPTHAGLEYPIDVVEALRDTRGLSYNPHPLGHLPARAAIAARCGSSGASVSPDHVMLSASTSEGYSFVFKLLCNAGDEVLVPVPSYPLFEHLARLDNVSLRRYQLEYHGEWSIDFDHLHSQLSSKTKIVVVVAPNNPTGSLLRREQWERLAALCAARGIAVVCDEVFLDYLLDPAPDAVTGVIASLGQAGGPLIFSLGGLSKSVGLPQLKLGWLALDGPADLVTAALERLQWIGDTYLSVGTPIQLAAATVLSAGAVVQEQIRSRLRTNLASLKARLVRSPACSLLRVEGGWSAVIRVPASEGEEALALSLAVDGGVLVHPGYFYDFSRNAHLVVSLLTPSDVFVEGVDRVCRRAEG